MKDGGADRKRGVALGLGRCVALLLFLAGLCATAGSSYASGLDGLKKAYGGISSLEATFHQKLTIANIKKVREFDGQFLCKRGKGFLWRYTKPKAKLFLYDGKYMWQDDEDKTFVLKDRISKEKTEGTFFDLFQDVAALDTLFTLKQESMERDMDVLHLVPKKEGTVVAARVWMDKQNLIRKIEIDEFTGNMNSIEFSSIKTNPNLGDGVFVFKPDGKKEIIER